MRAIFVGAALIFLAGCPRNEERAGAAHVDATTATEVDAAVTATGAASDLRREDFERVDDALGPGTHLCGRGAFLPEGDLRAFSAGDFLGRAASLFGPPAMGQQSITVRHRPTGIVLTLFFGASGASYRGGLVFRGPMPSDPQAVQRALVKQLAARAKAPPVAQSARDVEAALRSGRGNEAERLLCERAEPPGFARVARGLEALIEAAPLTDFEIVVDMDEGPYRMGVRAGKPFEEKVIDKKRRQ